MMQPLSNVVAIYMVFIYEIWNFNVYWIATEKRTCPSVLGYIDVKRVNEARHKH